EQRSLIVKHSVYNIYCYCCSHNKIFPCKKLYTIIYHEFQFFQAFSPDISSIKKAKKQGRGGGCLRRTAP
ncbi:MAG: hypothetical protein IJW23_09240, partial [Lentisphaeria bacterium]|nr:hypothetical protein [Lentisphaeria bacterium]